MLAGAGAKSRMLHSLQLMHAGGMQALFGSSPVNQWPFSKPVPLGVQDATPATATTPASATATASNAQLQPISLLLVCACLFFSTLSMACAGALLVLSGVVFVPPKRRQLLVVLPLLHTAPLLLLALGSAVLGAGRAGLAWPPA